ncbi:MAG: threonine/serine dehydratase [Sporichthyaceae bacterium]|nr:threonine/serine dehydratase [Sporichthyaceae bacterium]
MTDRPLVGIDDIDRAAERIAGVAVRTPLVTCAVPQRRPGTLLIKPESLQPIGAFKLRGAYNKIASLDPEQRGRGVVASSSGNHAQAVAYVACTLGIKATLVIPEGAAEIKIAATRAYGAEVVLVPPDQRDTKPLELAAEHGYTLVPPYDDPAVIAGTGTIGAEIAADLPDVDLVLVPVSGGGLISGIATAIKTRCPRARVIGVEPELAADAAESFRRGQRVEWSPELTFRTAADGLRVAVVGELPWLHIQRYVDDIVTVTEEQIRDAVRLLARSARLVAEPSGAVATAAHLAHPELSAGGTTAAVLSGGNVDPAQYIEILRG